MATSKSKSKIMRDHELNLALVKAFAEDPELKYYLGVAAGSGVAWVSTLLGQVGVTPQQSTESGGVGVGTTLGLTWLMGPLNPALAETVWNKIQAGGADMPSTVNNVLGLMGGGFAGFCGAVLILKALSGGQEGGLLAGLL